MKSWPKIEIKIIMIYHLSDHLKNYISIFNVVHYISFRVIISLLTALLLSFIFGSWFITQSEKFKAASREYTPETHRAKDGTPTMGGLFILLTSIFTTLLWCNLAKAEVWIFLLCLIGFGAIGFWDDWCKLKLKKGIAANTKFRLQVGLGLLVSTLWLFIVDPTTQICVPFLKNFQPELGLLLIPWATFIIVAMSNAVNLTDGLDGLAIGSLITNFSTFSIICYVAGNYGFANYLHIPFTNTSEITVIGSSLIGASIGFLWYNTYPAQIFMGDVGSLALGAALALMALMARQELLLIIAGGLFVAETMSVIIQVLSYKYRGKRFFKMAPIHHHFELIGWPEAKITTRFGIITLILCLLALITLKLR